MNASIVAPEETNRGFRPNIGRNKKKEKTKVYEMGDSTNVVWTNGCMKFEMYLKGNYSDSLALLREFSRKTSRR